MMTNFSVTEDSRPIKSMNYKKEITFNDKTYKYLSKKKIKLKSTLLNIKEKEDDLLYYNILNPIKINKNIKTQFIINKEGLNQLLIDLKKKSEDNIIYSNKLFELSNPYYLVKNHFLSKKHLSEEIIKNFEEEKEVLKERKINKFKNKYYDRYKKISFELPEKENYLNQIKNKRMIKEAINENRLIVELKNINDNFDKILLLKPDFNLEELKVLIRFLYKSIYGQENIKDINFYSEGYYANEAKIENITKIGDLPHDNESKYKLTIFVDALY